MCCCVFDLPADRLGPGSHGDSVLPAASLSAGELHRYIDGHKGRVAASMAWAGVGALDATFVPRQHAIAAILIYRRTEITYNYLVRRDPRVELRPNFLGPERVGPRAELALRLDFLVALQNLVDLVPR